ncbi:MAG TPA: ATPase, T2SS/T4P/T4SS family [Rhodocyclaceae bacterium]|nr:ATPase, T2SS/T4P/T4SS family [Rhodocyclaceae bacterium]HMW52230.1 ATPase, T2SS/T4P/T4SS family [Rhodocyclaceae bacterium]HMZ77345.1 ATPase, T2SS/T4P/T4SS family [Rhodocyclaceae bacterium]HNF62639.1 ATPase, T2SS/T4P/T4SS family [Rhodocyclaceae bacterium]
MNRPQRIRLGEVLLQQNLLTQAQLDTALEEQRRSGRKLGRIFVESGYVTEESLGTALARQLNIAFIDLRSHSPRAETVQLLSEALARRFRAIVLDDTGRALRIGMTDPTDLFAYDELARVLKRELELAVVGETALLAALDRLYHRGEEINGLAKALTAELTEDASDFAELFGSGGGQEDAPVVRLLQTVFEEAVRLRASDIHVEPQERTLRIRFRIDGVLYVQTEADVKIAPSVALRLKLMSGLDISEKRLPQDGRFNMTIRGAPVDVRISTLPSQYGESVVMRLLNQAAGLVSLDRIGLPDDMLVRLRRAAARPSGMILVTGPTGSGKTTTLYSVLAELNSTERKIITVEDPVEYRLPGINQVQVQDKIDLSFERVLRAALRQDPDVILVGEMRDKATAEIGMRASMTGHLVLSTLHTNDALSTPIRLLDMGVPRFMVAMSVQLVIAQRLIRKLCTNCAEPLPLQPHERAWLRLELGSEVDAHSFRHGRGCHLCNNQGYSGRMGIYEFLEMTPALVDAASHEDNRAFLEAGRAQIRGRTLRAGAMRLAAQGITSVAEAMRVANAQVEDEPDVPELEPVTRDA